MAAVYNGSEIKMYTNGVVDDTTYEETAEITGEGQVRIGHDDSAFQNRFLEGRIDDIRVYNYALSQNQVNSIMAGAGPGISSAVITGQPIGYWPLDAGYGSIAQDESINRNNGTIRWNTNINIEGR